MELDLNLGTHYNRGHLFLRNINLNNNWAKSGFPVVDTPVSQQHRLRLP